MHIFSLSSSSSLAFALLALGMVACSSEAEPVESESDSERQSEGAQRGEDDDVQVEVAPPEMSTLATCGTYCVQTNYGSIACNLRTWTGKTSYTCYPRYGSSYNTGCVTNRGSSYCISYF